MGAHINVDGLFQFDEKGARLVKIRDMMDLDVNAPRVPPPPVRLEDMSPGLDGSGCTLTDLFVTFCQGTLPRWRRIVAFCIACAWIARGDCSTRATSRSR